jgi:hypothetical protein
MIRLLAIFTRHDNSVLLDIFPSSRREASMKTTITTPNGQTIEVSIPRRRNLQSVVLTVLGALFVWGILFFAVSGT